MLIMLPFAQTSFVKNTSKNNGDNRYIQAHVIAFEYFDMLLVLHLKKYMLCSNLSQDILYSAGKVVMERPKAIGARNMMWSERGKMPSEQN